MSDRESAEPRSGEAAVDLLVIGGGIAGLLAAWRASEAGAGTLVVDASPERVPASRLAAGMIAPVGEATWGEERMVAAALASAERWPAFADRLAAAGGSPVPYRRCGALHVALDRDEAAELERRARLHRRLGLHSERLLGSDCRRLEPALATAAVAGISAPGEAEVDPRALLAAAEAAARRAGARISAGRVERLDPSSGRAELAGGRVIEAERIVLAAGAWAGETELVGAPRIPVRPVKGEIVRLRAASDEVPCRRIVVGERFYLVPRPSGEIVLGASVEERGFDTTVTAGGVFELLREAYRALPELAELELTEVGAGLRPGTPDNSPIIGPLGVGQTLVAGGLHRNGILLAPLLVDAVEAWLAGSALPQELEDLGPERFAGSRERVRG